MPVSELTNLVAIVRQNPTLWIALVAGIGLLLWLSHIYWRRKLTHWAESQGMRLIRFRGARFFEGPSKFIRSENQHLFRVIVEDHSGISHSAWVTFGSYWGFPWGIPLTDVEWDDEADY